MITIKLVLCVFIVAVFLQAKKVNVKTKKISKLFFLAFLISVIGTPLLAITGKLTDKLPDIFLITPQPKKIELLQGDGLRFGNLANLKINGEFVRPVMGEILTQLKESYVSDIGMLTLNLDTTEIAPESQEGYVLTISNGNVDIVSRGEAGLFYGCQTLQQLLEDARDFNTPIPACKITDFPALAYRAVHFDVKHHLDHMNVYYESIDRLARYKINAIIFEFEDKLRYQRQPLIGAPQAISIDEMAALTKYAKERHIEISPLVQGLGHATFILKHQEYAHLREIPNNRWAFCPMDEGTYDVLFDLYRDAIEATPGSRYLHIGGDEIGNIGLCPRCKPTADKEGILYLNLYWLKRVCKFVEENGRIPIFWDDMPLKYAGINESAYTRSTTGEEEAKVAWDTGRVILDKIIEQYPKQCVYMRWNYSMARQPGNRMTLDWYNEKGLQTMIATAAQSGEAALFPFDERDKGMLSRGIVAIKSFIELAAENGVDGMLCTAWDDRSPHMETYWRGFIASAEYSWSPGKRTLEQYDCAYLQREYGVSDLDYASLYMKLREAAVFWEKAFENEGSRLDSKNALFNLPGIGHWLPPEKLEKLQKNDFSGLLIDLPNLKTPGAWSEKYVKRLDEAELIIKEYFHTSKVLKGLYDNSKRNRYHWEVFSALNDFQVTAPTLLLALKQCDTTDEIQQKSGVVKLREALRGFDSAWEQLQEVYSKTRFIAYPANYVPDRYYHFASQREDLTSLIQVEELLHQQIKQWLILVSEQFQGKEKQEKIAPMNAPFEMPDLQRPVFQNKDFSIEDYEAIEGGEKLNEAAFQNAIDACNAAGGGKVIVPKGKWLTVPIVLKSNVNLYISEGAEVIITSDKKYFFQDEESYKKGNLSNPKSLISADHSENIAITGSGKIDGNGMGWWPLQPGFMENHKDLRKSISEKAWKGLDENIIQSRPHMFRPYYCKNVLLEGVTFSNSPYWTINPVVCENVIIRYVTVLAKATDKFPDTPNTDGINPESCKNVLIENCTIITGDDSFAIKSGKDEEGRKRGIASENIVIRNCEGRTIAIGSEMSGGVRNLFIHGLKLKTHFRIKTRRGRGGIVENIWLQDIQFSSKARAILSIDMEYWTHKVPAPYEPVSERTPKVRNIFFKNIYVENDIGQSAIYINGLPEMPVENLAFENIELSAKEGIICNNTNGASFRDISLTNIEKNVISIKSSKNLCFDHLEVDKVPDPFMSVKGSETEGIVLDKAWESNKANICFEDGANAEMIEFK